MALSLLQCNPEHGYCPAALQLQQIHTFGQTFQVNRRIQVGNRFGAAYQLTSSVAYSELGFCRQAIQASEA